jgi:hypothetical protein
MFKCDEFDGVCLAQLILFEVLCKELNTGE